MNNSRKELVTLAKKHKLMESLYIMYRLYKNIGYKNPVGLIVWLNQGRTEEEYVDWLLEARKYKYR